MESRSAGGPSIIQCFHNVWQDKSTGQRPEISLVTNRLPASEDPVIKLRDGRDGTVAQRLRLARPKSKAGIARRELATHLQITEAELLEFLSHLHFVVGRLYGEWKEQASYLMFAAGLRHDDEAMVLGISIVREWVTGGKRRLSVEGIRDALMPLSRPGELPTASLLVQAIDRDPMPENALISLDWVDLFPGDEPRMRRRPSDDKLWNNQFRPQLQEAARKLRASGCTRVLVRGYMRLPTWFVVGVELGKTAGYEVASFQGSTPWTSEGDVSEFPIETTVEELGDGTDIAIGIALASDPSDDVLSSTLSIWSQTRSRVNW